MSKLDTKDLIILSRSVKLRYQLDQYEDKALNEILRSVDVARRNIVKQMRSSRYVKQFSGVYTEYDQKTILLVNELDKLTLGIRSELKKSIADASTVAGENVLPEHNDILSFGGRVADFSFVRLTADQIRSMVTDVPVGGVLLSEWVDRTVSGRLKDGIKKEVMAGMFAGSGYPGIIKRVNQMMGDETKRNVTTLVRTYVQNINVSASESVYKANADVLKGLQWSAVLEPGYSGTGRGTCVRCQALDGTVYAVNEPHPPIPLHGRCRCILVPKTKTWRELGLDIDEIEEEYRPYTVRPNKNIDTGGKRTILEHGFHGGSYASWFEDQGEKFKINAVGPGRYELLKSGKIKFSDMVDSRTGRLMTIEELK